MNIGSNEMPPVVAVEVSSKERGEINIERIKSEITKFRKDVEGKFEGADAEKILDALEFMLELHCEQEDRIDGKPYIIHPLEVASDLVIKYEITEVDLIIGALLHDSVEDQSKRIIEKTSDEEIMELSGEELQNCALDVIANKYGDRVKELVKGLTNPNFNKIIEELETRGIKKEKRDLYKAHVKEAIESQDVFVVKLSDFLRNAENIPEIEPKKTHFIEKYGPVIKDVFIPAFEDMNSSHLLFQKRDDILSELNNVFEDKYKSHLEE